jgi:hypothetical protein
MLIFRVLSLHSFGNNGGILVKRQFLQTAYNNGALSRIGIGK